MLVILATNNPGKVRELRALFAWEGWDGQLIANCDQLVSLAELGLAFTPGEDGGTFEANATQKAVETMAFLKDNAALLPDLDTAQVCVLSDDSGLVIDALDGEPGVDSALYLGADTPFAVRNADILARMQEVSDDKRTARFVCVAACCFADGSVDVLRGELEGVITREVAGTDGFGYDPIFYVPQMGRTLAEMAIEEKNVISHRGKAMRAMKERLEEEPVISFLVTSDTHNETKRLEALLARYAHEIHGVFHLGDHDYDLLQFADTYALPRYTVAGNCDDESLSPRERVVEISGQRIFMAHGDRFNVGGGTNRLVARARELDATVCLFGHTHIPTCATQDGILVINPGSLTSPRDGQPPSHVLLTLDKSSGTCNGKIVRA